VVYRAFGDPAALELGRVLARLARARGVLFFVGADVELARRLKADGLHLPQRLCRRRGDIDRWSRRFIVTGAAHDPLAVARARRSAIAAIVISPVFPSQSPSAGRPLGLMGFARLARLARKPAIALGGVTGARAAGLRQAGASGMAGIDGFIETTTER